MQQEWDYADTSVMASRVLNPRFDHWCRIYRYIGGTEMTKPDEVEVLYEGKCMIYEANNLRAYREGIAYKEDMGCDIPGLIDNVRVGDLIDYDRYGIKGQGLKINTPVPSKMGSTFRFNQSKV